MIGKEKHSDSPIDRLFLGIVASSPTMSQPPRSALLDCYDLRAEVTGERQLYGGEKYLFRIERLENKAEKEPCKSLSIG